MARAAAAAIEDISIAAIMAHVPSIGVRTDSCPSYIFRTVFRAFSNTLIIELLNPDSSPAIASMLNALLRARIPG